MGWVFITLFFMNDEEGGTYDEGKGNHLCCASSLPQRTWSRRHSP